MVLWPLGVPGVVVSGLTLLVVVDRTAQLTLVVEEEEAIPVISLVVTAPLKMAAKALWLFATNSNKENTIGLLCANKFRWSGC